jgi:hypothetical protein
MRRMLGIAVFLGVVMPATSYAQQQSINFSLGGFVPRGEDARTSGDVLVNNLDFLAFNIKKTFQAARLAPSGNFR